MLVEHNLGASNVKAPLYAANFARAVFQEKHNRVLSAQYFRSGLFYQDYTEKVCILFVWT